MFLLEGKNQLCGGSIEFTKMKTENQLTERQSFFNFFSIY